MADKGDLLRHVSMYMLLKQPGTAALQQFLRVFYKRLKCTDFKCFLSCNYHTLFRLHNRKGSCHCGCRGIGSYPPIISQEQWEVLFQQDRKSPCKTKITDSITEKDLDIRLCYILIVNIDVERKYIEQKENGALEVIRINWNKIFLQEGCHFSTISDSAFEKLWRNVVDAVVVLARHGGSVSEVRGNIARIESFNFEEDRYILETEVKKIVMTFVGMTKYNDSTPPIRIYQSMTFLLSSTFYPIMRGFHRTSAMGVACRQGTLSPPDTWSRPIWNLHMFYLLRQILYPNL